MNSKMVVVVVPGVAFAICQRGCEFLLASLGEGFGVGFRWVLGCGFPMEKKGKGGRGWGGLGVGWGQTKELANRCARVCQNYPLAIYSLAFPRRLSFWVRRPPGGCLLRKGVGVDKFAHSLESYHDTQNDYQTELYFFLIIFGSSCSTITGPNCFSELLGLGKRVWAEDYRIPYRIVLGIRFGNLRGGITEPK